MGNLIETSVFEEMIEAEEGFETELIHEVNGVTVCEPLEDVLEREKCCTICEFSEPGDGCGANDLSELGQLEMEAELSVGI
jgi:hypothetical protein